MHGLCRVGFYRAEGFIENVEQINILELKFLHGSSLDILAKTERIWAKSAKTGQIRFFEKIEIAMQNLCIVTICGVLFIKNEVCFRFRYLHKLENLF
jgi:hypothetical protein